MNTLNVLAISAGLALAPMTHGADTSPTAGATPPAAAADASMENMVGMKHDMGGMGKMDCMDKMGGMDKMGDKHDALEQQIRALQKRVDLLQAVVEKLLKN